MDPLMRNAIVEALEQEWLFFVLPWTDPKAILLCAIYDGNDELYAEIQKWIASGAKRAFQVEADND